MLLHAYFSWRSKARWASLLAAVTGLLGQLAAAQTPALLSTTPQRNALAASRTAPVQLTFSAALDPATIGTIRLLGSQYRGVRPAAASISGSTVALTLPTGTSFGPGEQVSVSVPATVRSLSGQTAGPLTYQFTTAVTGTGRGTFTTATDVACGYEANATTLGDIDGDGDLDLVLPPPAANFVTPSSVLVRLNSGSGTFSAGTAVSIGGPPASVALADLDGDGDLDLLAVYPTGSTSSLSVRLNDGRGHFSAGSELAGLVTGGHLLDTKDLDGDGDYDLVVGTNTAGQSGSTNCLNRGNGTFVISSQLFIGGGTGAFTLGDIDNDGDVDYLTTGFTTGEIYVCLNNGLGMFGSMTTYTVGNNPASIALADVDGDGDLDLLAGCAGNNTVIIRLNDGKGHFATTGASVAVGNYPGYLRLADLDSDGDQDILTSNLYGGSVSVCFNTGGSFTGGAAVALATYTHGLAIGDLDGDNDIDFVALTQTGSTAPFISIGFNQGPASPPPAPPAPTCSAADTTATLGPASGVVLGCGQAPASLLVAPAPAGATYEWQYAPAAGAAWQVLPAASLPTYQPTQPGRYRVRVRTQSGCVARSAAVEARPATSQAYDIPNIFTPNGDGLNDQFELRLAAPLTSEVVVFNRWGREVFRSSSYGDFWTGAGSSAGLYFYLWRYSTACDPTEHLVRGTITVAR